MVQQNFSVHSQVDDSEWSRDASTPRLRWSRIRTQFSENRTFSSDDWLERDVAWWRWCQHAFNLPNNSSSIFPRHASSDHQKFPQAFDSHWTENHAENVGSHFFLRTFPAWNTFPECSSRHHRQSKRREAGHLVFWQTLPQPERRENHEKHSKRCHHSCRISLPVPSSRHSDRAGEIQKRKNLHLESRGAQKHGRVELCAASVREHVRTKNQILREKRSWWVGDLNCLKTFLYQFGVHRHSSCRRINSSPEGISFYYLTAFHHVNSTLPHLFLYINESFLCRALIESIKMLPECEHNCKSFCD